MSSRDSPCPFCGFVCLGLHLPRCKERDGRVYSAFVSKKRAAPSSRGVCPSCERHFKRLDTHLRVSRVVAPTQPPLSATPGTTLHSMNRINQTTVPTDGPSIHVHRFKQPLRLPRTPVEWEEANHLLSSVTQSVLQAITAEEKNTCLCTGIYDILSARFGTRSPSRHRKQLQSKFRQHDRALNEVTRLKNEARRDLRRAKREGVSGAIIQSLAANFLSLLRKHSDSAETPPAGSNTRRPQLRERSATATSGSLQRSSSMETLLCKHHRSSQTAQHILISLRYISQFPIISRLPPGCHPHLIPSQTAPWIWHQYRKRS